MPGDVEAVSNARVVRATLDVSRLPWAHPLQTAYENDFGAVAPFFSGHPGQPDAWTNVIGRVQRSGHDRAAVAALLEAQLSARDAPAEARKSAARLAEPRSVAIVTGQQAGLFGGPLYTLLKAITTIQLARQVEATHEVVTVPIFWVAAEDHDWAEVRSTVVLDRNMAAQTVAVPDLPGAGTHAVGALAFDERIGEVVDTLSATLPPTAWTADVIAELRRHYRPGANLGAAMIGWLDYLLGRHGLVVFDGADPAAKPLVADLFAAELDAPERTAGEVRRQGAALEALGLGAQVVPADHATALFYLDDKGRHPIRFLDGSFRVGETSHTPAELRQEATAHPERFSPNVMLRAVVQDRLFPTICYVAGPGELAYQAQFGGVYAAFGVERPLFACRASATLLDSAAARFLERFDVPFEELAVADDSVLNQLIERVLVPDIGPAVASAEAAIRERLAALTSAAVAVDATLAGAADSTVTRMRHALDVFRRKIVRAAKRRDDTLRRQFTRARTMSFPDGHPQERTLGVAAAINQYGPHLVDRLLEDLPIDGGRHHLVVP